MFSNFSLKNTKLREKYKCVTQLTSPISDYY